ncbi:MAG: ZIP family metal transporter [Patescibacteria group bacterium]
MVILIGLAAVVFTALGGLFAIKIKDKLHLVLGFSAGTVLGVALFDLIPESFELAGENYGIQLAALFVALGFAFFMIIDRFFSVHSHADLHCENPRHGDRLGAAALIFHSFLDGLAIGLAFKVSPEVGWIVAIAILAHNFSDGINTVNMILKDHGNRKQAIKWLLLDAAAPITGVIVSQFITVGESILGLILAIFAGIFLYIGACELIPESHHRHPTIWTTILTLLGIGLIYIAVSFAG